MIVVFIAYMHPPLAFETTEAQLIAQAMDVASHVATLPNRATPSDFGTAWALLTRDLKTAFQFPDVDAARAHVLNDDQLSMHERTMIISALERLSRSTLR